MTWSKRPNTVIKKIGDYFQIYHLSRSIFKKQSPNWLIKKTLILWQKCTTIHHFQNKSVHKNSSYLILQNMWRNDPFPVIKFKVNTSIRRYVATSVQVHGVISARNVGAGDRTTVFHVLTYQHIKLH